MHLLYDVVEFGALSNVDTVLYENLHIPFAKEAYRSSSRRYKKLYDEMIAGIQAARLIRILGDENDREQEEKEEQKEGEEEKEEYSLSYKANLYHVHKRGGHHKSVTYLVPKGHSYTIVTYDVNETSIHICAILSLHNVRNGVCKIIYIGCETKSLTQTNRSIDSPFPVVQYSRARSIKTTHIQQLVFNVNMFDIIMQPAFIIPISRNEPMYMTNAFTKFPSNFL